MNDNISNNNKRNIIIATTAIVLALILAVIGVSYAFFSLQVNGEGTTTNIEISTGVAGGITLSGKVENFHISVNATDMAYKNLGDYYATDNQDKNYADSKEDGIKDLGRIDISGTLSEINSCSATIKLEFTTSILEKIQEGDFTLGLIYGEEEQEIDLTNIPSEGTAIEFELDGTINPSYIKAYLKLNNADRDQSYLADQEMKVKVSVDSFVCEAGNKGEKNLELLKATTDEDHLKVAYEGDELIRYIGNYDEVTYKTDSVKKAINNFICFGTNNIDTCTKSPATYMYRIIGITTENVNRDLGLEKNQLKIIKAEPNSDGKSVAWNDDFSSDIPWDSADVQKTYLNTTFMKTITDIKELVGTHNWSDLIGVNESPNNGPKWYIGDKTSYGASETTTKSSSQHQIGLMYQSDYYNSWSYGSNTNSWLNICHGRTGTSISCGSYYEWTMTRYGYSGGSVAWDVHWDGSLGFGWVSNTNAVRPVFYLTSNITISGKGTEASPFIINAD